jgi:hypothetical protein
MTSVSKRVEDKYLHRRSKSLDKEAGLLTENDAPNMIEILKNPKSLQEHEADLHFLECKHEKTAKKRLYYLGSHKDIDTCIYCGHEIKEAHKK